MSAEKKKSHIIAWKTIWPELFAQLHSCINSRQSYWTASCIS